MVPFDFAVSATLTLTLLFAFAAIWLASGDRMPRHRKNRWPSGWLKSLSLEQWRCLRCSDVKGESEPSRRRWQNAV